MNGSPEMVLRSSSRHRAVTCGFFPEWNHIPSRADAKEHTVYGAGQQWANKALQ
jgi:hypothetical protein